ncbi:MAG: AF1514 family protein [Thermodesulfobacteriota bacterium]
MQEMIPNSGQDMQAIAISVTGQELNWDLARDLAQTIAVRDEDELIMLISWFDRARGKFSPSCCKCDTTCGPAWEVYGKNHGGRLRISVNNDDYVFIYS